jgi:tripartite-type tricarboxylate transporter receptor subunit TctC
MPLETWRCLKETCMHRSIPRRTLLAASLAAPALARAEVSFPERPIRLIIPWPPGASADVFLRMLAEQAGKRLGQLVLPENRPGAKGSSGNNRIGLSGDGRQDSRSVGGPIACWDDRSQGDPSAVCAAVTASG